MKRSLMLLPMLAALLSAQEFRGTFSGNVTDQQGAGIPKVKVTATETRTGAISTAYSEASGAYTIPFLALGQYEIAAEAPGFKKFVRTGLTLSAGEHPVIDIRLDVGIVTESVTVAAESPLVNEANASVGQVIPTAEVEDLPVNGRTPMMLAHLAFGVLSTFEPGPVRPFDNGSANSLSIGGATSGSNEVLLNGAPNANFGKAMAYSPSQDVVQEVRVNVFDADAAYGHSSGGNINLITKTGTNSFHGAAYEFNQVSYLNANFFFFNKTGTPKPAYRQNQYGVVANGPMYVPKIFDGRNRLFWLFSWEGMRDSDPANSPIETGSPINFATVPTAAERKGDFSGLLAANKPGTNYTIYDPQNAVLSGTTVTRQPFPNNVIPTARLNPVALAFLKFFPEPNLTGRIDGFQNYVVNAIDSDNYDNELGQLDWVREKNKLSFNVRHNYRVQDKNNYFHNLSTGTFLYRINQGASFDDVYTISPSMILNVRGNWSRYMENRGFPSDGFDLTSVGFPASYAKLSPGLKMPRLVFTNTTVTAGSLSSFQTLGTDDNGGSQPYDSFQVFGDVMKIRGNHSLKVGADARQYRWSNYAQGYSSGTFTFNSNWTNVNANSTGAPPLGQDLAAFLLGLPTSGQFDLNTQSTTQSMYYALFIQDDWRARRNLTINAGLRFDHDLPTTERFNRAVNGFDPSAVNSASAPAAAAFKTAQAAGAYNGTPLATLNFQALGGLTFPTATNRLLYHTQSYTFSPRFGFAWTPNALKGTVLRGGFAAFVAPIETLGNGNGGNPSLNQAGFSQSTSFTATNDSYLTPAATLSDPFPTGLLAPTGGGPSTFLGQSLTFYNPNPRNAYSLRWNFGIQREIPGKIVMELAYIGNHAVHLPIATQLDYLPRQYLSTSMVRDQATIDMLSKTTGITNPFRGYVPTGLTGTTTSVQQLLLPYPEFTGITMNGNPAGSSYYHSMNLRLQKRFTNRLTFLYNFQYSKLVSKINYLNDSDFGPEKRVANDNRPIRNVLWGSYELPFGRGTRLDLGHVGNAIAGGWSFNGALTLQSGSQIGLGNLIYFGGPLDLNGHQPDGTAFNIDRFDHTSNQQLDRNIRYLNNQFGNLRRDYVKNLDLSLIKRVSLGEQRYLQLRFETFNTTNRVTFANPNTTATSTAFGTIGSTANTPRRIQIGARLVW